MGIYRTYETTIPTAGASPPDGLAPPWLARPAGQAWLGAFGDLKDWLADRAKQGVKARAVALAPSDAVPLIGAERQLSRGIAETEVAFRARIAAAWQLWQNGGTAFGLLTALVTAGYPSPYVLSQNGLQYQLDANGALVTTTLTSPSVGALKSDFGVIIGQPWPTRWLGVAPADGSNEQKTVSAIIAAWKPAHARCVSLIVQNGNLWGFGGLTWGGASLKWGAGSNTIWTPPAG